MEQNCALFTAGIVFAFVGVMHLLRVIFKIEIRVGKFNIPQWLSMIGFVIAIALAIWMFMVRA